METRNESLAKIEALLEMALSSIKAIRVDVEQCDRYAGIIGCEGAAETYEEAYVNDVCSLVKELAQVKGMVNDYLLGDEFYNIDLL